MAQTSLHTIPGDGLAHRLRNHEPDSRRVTYCFVDIWYQQMHDEQAVAGSTSAPYDRSEISSVGQAVAWGKHIRPPASDCEVVPALTATSGQDRATRTGPHPETETVHLVTTTVVRLVRTLAHEYLHALCRGVPVLGRVRDRVARQRSRQSSGRTTGTARPRDSHKNVAWSWTCGTGRTGLDLPTVRATSTHGQFTSNPRSLDGPKRNDAAPTTGDIHSDTPMNP